MSSAPASFEFDQLETVEIISAEEQGVRLAEASAIIETARAEAEAIREAARQDGFQAGYQQGLAGAQEYLAPSVQALAAVQEALGDERGRAAEAVEREAVELAFRIAEKALGAAIEAKPEHVVDVVRGGLRRLLERERVVVMVHPDDLDVLRAAADGLQAELGGIGSMEVQAERRVGRGGAIVRTAAGEVDGRLEVQLERAREAMLEALKPSADLAD
ncbi:MAG TPA: FliH/SctL family protein [Solirubrobacteraceae bacterium]|nr:FliH/SctL family protein [Solirubrobacteraceae bacterium]